MSTHSFYGATYDQALDGERLTRQIDRIRAIMLHAAQGGEWLTLHEISVLSRRWCTGYGESSISAQLRNLRKRQFGGYIVSRRRRGAPQAGLWEYFIEEAPPATQERLF